MFSICYLFLSACLAEIDPEKAESLPEPNNEYYKYLKERRLSCFGDGALLPEEKEIKFGQRVFVYNGWSLAAKDKDADGVIKIGALGATKDFIQDTKKTLNKFLDEFEKEKVDAVVLLGDVAEYEEDITNILMLCAQRGFLVLAFMGNTESRAAFNRGLMTALKAYPNIVNMNFVRRVDLGGAVLFSLPGYNSKEFRHTSSGCVYKPTDIKALYPMAEKVKGPKIFLCHGPPQGKGPKAMDFVAEAGNVGELMLNEFINRNNIQFGLFSHILEAGGSAIDKKNKLVPPNKWRKKLYINVGSANPLRWTMNNGKTSCGMAVVFTIKDDLGAYKIFRNSCASQ
jgi:Icc-related predicted phosphoesterase